MSQAPSMPLFCDAYLADTMHLTLEEHGAYLKLLMVTWRNNGQPLPDDDARMARMLGVTMKRWVEKLRPVLAGFFDLSEGTWRQARLEKEWLFVQERAAKSRANGSQGGRPKSLKKLETENPAGSSQQTQNEPTHTHTQSQEETGGEESAGVRPITPSVEIIRAFDAERTAVFGPERSRGWAHQTDKIVADRWIAEGADLELCQAVFHAGCRKLAAEAQPPPDTLSFFTKRIANALATRSRPMPEGVPNDQRRPLRSGRPAGGFYADILERDLAGSA